MSTVEQLNESVNEFLKQNELPVVGKESINDFILLYKESLVSIWQNKNLKKRQNLTEELNNLFLDYVSIIELKQVYKEIQLDLDNKYPPEIILYDIYKIVLDGYKQFLNDFINTNNLNIDILNDILKKIFLILENDKDKIITHISLNFEDYDFHVNHGINSTIIALIGGKELKFSDKELYDLGISGLLHDIGMMKIPEHILNKKDKLTEEEFEVIKKHTIIGYKDISEKNIFSQDILEGIVQHHEQFDGNGYPKKLHGNKIHKYAKILSIADAFESQVSYRSYRRSKNGHIAVKEVIKDINNRFDPLFLDAFLTVISIYPPGTLVQINNNAVGTVFSINPGFPLRPRIKIIIDEFGYKADREILIDLLNDPSLFIIRVLNKDEYIRK